MISETDIVVLRLNARTCPPTVEERRLLGSVAHTVVEIEGETEEELFRHVPRCDALMVVSARVRAPVIEAMERCRIISRLGTGTDKIDIAAANARGILVTNIPDFCTEEVADHTMALLLAAARRLDHFQNLARQGKGAFFSDVPLHRLAGRALGIVGFGRIGKAVARRARSFGLRIFVNDPQVSEEEVQREGATRQDFSELLASVDILCLLCPLTPATRRMLTLREFRSMKRDAILVNTARGELVDEDALAQALDEGIIAHAALDVFGCVNVFSPDGFSTHHPLFHCRNVTLTPHVAACSVESMAEHRRRGAQAVVDALAGRWPAHVVNRDVHPRFCPRGVAPGALNGARALSPTAVEQTMNP